MECDRSIWEAYDRAAARLVGHPSVRSVELGWKVSGGELKRQLAVRVYVDAKVPIEQLPPDLLIPPELAGLPTDVITVREQRFAGHSMRGGDKITRIVWNDEGSGSGTLGYIATRVADSKPVMLSNEHVFRNDRGSTQRERELFQPDISCRALGSRCNYVGFAIDGHMDDFTWQGAGPTPQKHFIDCAIGEIDKAKNDRGISKVGPIAGDRDITGVPIGPGNTPIAVKKMGARTGLTEGDIVSINSTGHEKVGPFEIQNQPLTVLIRATKGPSFDETFEVPAADQAPIAQRFQNMGVPGTVTQLPGNKLRFQIPFYFADHGDSGSAIVAGDRVVGLLYAVMVFVFTDKSGKDQAVPLGEALACHIGPVMARLGIRIDAASAISSGVPEPADRAFAVHEPELAERIAAFEADLGQSSRGRQLRALIRDHGSEIVDLVHHRKRVLSCWHRYQGPAFAALIVDAIRRPGRTIPRAHAGVSLARLLTEMRDILLREGGSSLRASVEENGEWLLGWLPSGGLVSDLVSGLADETQKERACG
jgi:hypothetical protein